MDVVRIRGRWLAALAVCALACGGEDNPGPQRDVGDAEAGEEDAGRDGGRVLIEEDEDAGRRDAATPRDAGADSADSRVEEQVGDYVYRTWPTPLDVHGHGCAINDDGDILVCGDASDTLWRVSAADGSIVVVDPPAGHTFDAPATTQVCLSPGGTVFAAVKNAGGVTFVAALGAAVRVSTSPLAAGQRVLGCVDDRVLYGSDVGFLWEPAADRVVPAPDSPLALTPDGDVLTRGGLVRQGAASEPSAVCATCALPTAATSGGRMAGDVYDGAGEVRAVYRFARGASSVDELDRPDAVALVRAIDTQGTVILSTLAPVTIQVVRDDALADITPPDPAFFGVTLLATSPGGTILGEGVFPGGYRLFTLDPRY